MFGSKKSHESVAERFIAQGSSFTMTPPAGVRDPRRSDLENFFDARTEGRGIWKWRHYFDAYDQHFSRFRGVDVHILEIGVFSGGSLEMWREYFGPQAHVIGMDLLPECRAYESTGIEIVIGDQGRKETWDSFRETHPRLDIVVDDGSHDPAHQILTFEQLFPHISPGGVFLCEDVHGRSNPFSFYCAGLLQSLNAIDDLKMQSDGITLRETPVQQSIRSIDIRPFVTIIEKTSHPAVIAAPKHGTEWNPSYALGRRDDQ